MPGTVLSAEHTARNSTNSVPTLAVHGLERKIMNKCTTGKCNRHLVKSKLKTKTWVENQTLENN